MRTIFALLAVTLCCYADSTSHVTYSSPTYVPPTMPACNTTPFSIQRTVTYDYTVWDCRTNAVYGGHVSATGTGTCQGGLAHSYCRTGDNSIAPEFSFATKLSSDGKTWFIWVNITSISPGGNLGTGGVECGVQAMSSTTPQQAPSPNCLFAKGPSPIVLDTRDEGFHLTDAAHGVVLDGIQLSWTDHRYGNGWLVRPNPDGTWNDLTLAKNFFGNESPQPPSPEPNGYLALKYLAAQNGCPGLSSLTQANCASVWSILRVWLDNGDGVVQPGEIYTLSELGYTSLSLAYRDSSYMDQYGNRFRYVSSVADDDKQRERCYDVFLVTR